MVDKTACRLWELYAAIIPAALVGRLRRDLEPDLQRAPARTAGRPPTPRACRSTRASSGTTRSPRARSPTRCGSRCRRRAIAHIYPARHDAGAGTSASLPPMGLRVRLKASVNISSYAPRPGSILNALKRYGMILADNGSAYYVSGAPDPRWDDDDLHELGRITGSMSRSSTRAGSSTAERRSRPRARWAAGPSHGPARATAARGRSSSPRRGPAGRRSAAPARRAGQRVRRSPRRSRRGGRPAPAAANSVSPLNRRPSSTAWRQTEPGV